MRWCLMGLALVLLFAACALRPSEWEVANTECRSQARSIAADYKARLQKSRTELSPVLIDDLEEELAGQLYDRCMKEQGSPPY